MEGGGRRVQERRRRREYLLNISERLFAEQGFFKTTMSQIAKESEFALATIYRFFKSKEDLYFTLIEEKMEMLINNVHEAVARVTSSIEKIKALIRAQMTFFENHPHFFKILMTEKIVLQEGERNSLRERIARKYNSYLNSISEIIRKGIRRGELKRMDPRETSYTLAEMLYTFTLIWLSHPGKGSLAARANSLVELFLRGTQQ